MAALRRKSLCASLRELTTVATDLKTLSNPKTPIELARRLCEESPLSLARIAEIIGLHPSPGQPMPTRPRKSSQISLRELIATTADLKAISNPKTPLELARRLYEQSPLPVGRIAEIVGIHYSSLWRISRREGWKPRKAALHGNDLRFARRFHFAAAGAARKGLTNAEVARAFATRSPKELAAQREAIVAELWDRAQTEIAKINIRKRRGREIGDLLLMSRTIESLLRMRKRLDGLQAPEAVRSRDEIGASILALLDEMEGEKEGGEGGAKEAMPPPLK
jgi:hypothetical protein